MPIDLDELKAWRAREGLSQREVGELLGFNHHDRYGELERGKRPISGKLERQLARLIAGDQGSGSSSPNGAAGPAPAGGADDDGADLPPLAISPGPQPSPDDDDGPRRSTAKSRRLSEIETIELELHKLLAGSSYLYQDFVDGRPVTKTGHTPGAADLLDAVGFHGDAELVRQLAPQLAHGYAEWARSSKRVLGVLRMLTAGGAAKEALIPTAQLVVGLAMLHGFLPSPAVLLGGRPAANGDSPQP